MRPARVRVVVDGYTASGKTSFGHELAASVRVLGRSTMRATFDDFKKPWADALEQGYDRVTGDGYYRNAPDFEAARGLQVQGCETTVVHLMSTLMERQLDADAGNYLCGKMEDLGIEVLLGRTTTAILGVDRVEGVALSM